MADSAEPAGRASASEADKTAARRSPNPIRRLTLVVLVLGLIVFVYGLFADRLTPYTDQATVQAYVVTLAPDISGRVVAVNVADNQPAKAGQVLFAIDAERYQTDVASAEAQLSTAGLNIGASTASLAAAEARLAVAEANLANVKEQSGRVFNLVRTGVHSKASGDEAKASLHSAVADVRRGKAEVEQARQNLGPLGDDNPQIRQAQASLRKARRDLADTVVRAPANGVVTNLALATGQFVSAGQAALTFIDSDAIWIDAELRENSLEHIKVGDPVSIVLDVRPGRVYPGKVESIGWGVHNRDVDPKTGLPTLKDDTAWIRDPQRFVVRVRFEPEKRPKAIRLGSQANVVVYTRNSGLTDAIGRVWIGLVSYLSYLR